MSRTINRIVGIVALAVASLTGCETVIDPIACTEIFAYGLSVEVVDSITGAPRATGATLTLTEGSYVESTTESFDGRTMLGAGERAGTYGVVVERPDYMTWTAAPVVIGADECHVIPVSLRAQLQPTP